MTEYRNGRFEKGAKPRLVRPLTETELHAEYERDERFFPPVTEMTEAETQRFREAWDREEREHGRRVTVLPQRRARIRRAAKFAVWFFVGSGILGWTCVAFAAFAWLALWWWPV